MIAEVTKTLKKVTVVDTYLGVMRLVRMTTSCNSSAKLLFPNLLVFLRFLVIIKIKSKFSIIVFFL